MSRSLNKTIALGCALSTGGIIALGTLLDKVAKAETTMDRQHEISRQACLIRDRIIETAGRPISGKLKGELDTCDKQHQRCNDYTYSTAGTFHDALSIALDGCYQFADTDKCRAGLHVASIMDVTIAKDNGKIVSCQENARSCYEKLLKQ